MEQRLKRRSRDSPHEVHQDCRKESADHTQHYLRERYLLKRVLHKAGRAHGHRNVRPIGHKLSGNAQAVVTRGIAVYDAQLGEIGRWRLLDEKTRLVGTNRQARHLELSVQVVQHLLQVIWVGKMDTIINVSHIRWSSDAP
eukprot:6281242-Amphidinium_carterae.2